MRKNYMEFIIAAMLMTVVLSGCGQNENGKSADASQPIQTITDEAESDNNDGENEAPAYEEDEQDETMQADVVEEEDEPAVEIENPEFDFSTTDIDGNDVGISDYLGAKLIMVNFWEPWCGPCVREMPDLEKIYEEYNTEGFLILGVFSTEGMDDEVRAVLDSCGTTYPILRYAEEMEPYTTDYVPTTVFLDGHGNVISDEPIIGSNSYDDWKQIIDVYMNQ